MVEQSFAQKSKYGSQYQDLSCYLSRNFNPNDHNITSGNLFNFNTKNNGPSFLTPKTRAAFNHLWLAFTKALIL